MTVTIIDRGQYALNMESGCPHRFAPFGHFFEKRMAEAVIEAHTMKVSHCVFRIVEDGVKKVVEVKITEYIGKINAFDIEMEGDVEGRYLAYREGDNRTNYSVSLSSNLSEINEFIKAFKGRTGLPMTPSMIERKERKASKD